MALTESIGGTQSSKKNTCRSCCWGGMCRSVCGTEVLMHVPWLAQNATYLAIDTPTLRATSGGELTIEESKEALYEAVKGVVSVYIPIIEGLC